MHLRITRRPSLKGSGLGTRRTGGINRAVGRAVLNRPSPCFSVPRFLGCPLPRFLGCPGSRIPGFSVARLPGFSVLSIPVPLFPVPWFPCLPVAWCLGSPVSRFSGLLVPQFSGSLLPRFPAPRLSGSPVYFLFICFTSRTRCNANTCFANAIRPCIDVFLLSC